MNQRTLSTLCGLALLCAALHAPGVLGDEAQQKSPEPAATLSTIRIWRNARTCDSCCPPTSIE